MKALNRGELRRPHKDRTHPDYKHSVCLGTDYKRERPARDRVGPLVIHARMADGTFRDVRTWTGPADAASHKAAKWGTRKERRAARDAALALAGSKLASGVARGAIAEVSARAALAVSPEVASC